MPDETSPAPEDHIEFVDRLFAEALDLPPDAREQYILDATGVSPSLRGSVLKLLGRFDGLGEFLERPAGRAANAREFLPGAVIAGRFLIEKRIGRGGMGDVYLAQDRGLGEKVALKTIRAEWRGDDSVLARFRDEIKLARRIGHHNVCKIFDLFSENNPDGSQTAFFTMEYLPGESLAEHLLRVGRLEPAEAVRIAQCLAAGLDAAHGRGIIHRDLKPSNIILADDGARPVITDFGLAKPLDEPSGSSTQTGVIAGSPDYMAPEQFLGETLTTKVDIFAFALIFYEMLTGTRPWPPESLLRAAVRRITTEPRTLKATVSGVPSHWDAILRRALATEPSRRPASAGELVSELSRERSGLVRVLSPIVARRPSRRLLLVGGGAAIGVSSLAVLSRLYEREAPESPVVMLVPVTSDSNPAAARSLDLLIEQSLKQSVHVSVLPPEKMTAAWARMGHTTLPPHLTAVEAREIALRASADYVLFPELARANGEWAIKGSLERIGSSPLHPRTERVERFYSEDERGLIGAAARAAEWVRGACGEGGQEIASRNRAPEEVTTSSWEALKEYTAAVDAWKNRPKDREWPPDQLQAAENHLSRALEIDPEFARAAAFLADIQVASRKYDEGLLNHERAANLIARRNLTDRESLSIRGMFALDSGQYAKAQQVFARFAEEYPKIGLPLFHEARAVECLGNAEGSLHLLEQAVRKEPENYSYQIDRGIRYLFLGRFDEAQKDCDRAAKKNPSDWVDLTRAALAFARRDVRGVWNALEHLKTNGSVSYRGRALALAGCLRAEQKRVAEAQALFEEALRFDRLLNQPPALSIRKYHLLAGFFAGQGRRREAAETCRTILKYQPGIRPTLEAGAILAQVGELDAARDCLPKGVAKNPPASVPSSLGPDAARQLIEWPVYFRRILSLWAELALTSGDAKTAFLLISSAPPPEASQEWPDLLVRASIASGELATAENKLSSLFRNPAAYWIAAEGSPPGFMRRAIEQARQLNMPAALWSPLAQLLN